MVAAGRRPLKLRAEDQTDLAIIAACLQDAVVPVREMRFLPDERRFAFVANRYCWEGEAPEGADLRQHERVLCAVVFETVASAQMRGFKRGGEGEFLDLLSIGVEPEKGGASIILTFAGGAGVRLKAARLRVRVEDLSEPWPTPFQPKHE